MSTPDFHLKQAIPGVDVGIRYDRDGNPVDESDAGAFEFEEDDMAILFKMSLSAGPIAEDTITASGLLSDTVTLDPETTTVLLRNTSQKNEVNLVKDSGGTYGAPIPPNGCQPIPITKGQAVDFYIKKRDAEDLIVSQWK